MLLGASVSGVVRAGVTSGLSSTGVYSFFAVLENPILPSFLSSSNNYFTPFEGFPIATLGIMYLADNPPGRFKELNCSQAPRKGCNTCLSLYLPRRSKITNIKHYTKNK